MQRAGARDVDESPAPGSVADRVRAAVEDALRRVGPAEPALERVTVAVPREDDGAGDAA